MWYQGGVIVCVFSLPLTPPKEMFASQNVEKTSTKTERECVRLKYFAMNPLIVKSTLEK